MRPLDGITVLDLTRFLPGAVATMWLVRYGAEVIKVERPGEGDPARHLGDGSLFAYTNRGKKSIALNLKDARGQRLFHQMVKRADVVTENFRPGVMQSFSSGYEALAGMNTQLIYVSLTGYRPNSTLSRAAGHDINYMAISGMLDLLSPCRSSAPAIPQVQLADIAGGSQQVLVGLLLALYARTRTGRGQRVDVSMVAGMTDLASVPIARQRSDGLAGHDDVLSGRFACYSLYQCKDGRWIAVGALEPKFWANLCRELHREDLQAGQFLPEPQQSQKKAALAAVFAERSAEEWSALLVARDCCVTPVRTFPEAYAAGQFDELDVGTGARLSAAACELTEDSVPALGQNTAEIIARLEWSPECAAEMKREGVLA